MLTALIDILQYIVRNMCLVIGIIIIKRKLRLQSSIHIPNTLPYEQAVIDKFFWEYEI